MFIAHWIFLDILMKTEKHFVDWIKYGVEFQDNYVFSHVNNRFFISYSYLLSDIVYVFKVVDVDLYEKTNDCVIKMQAIIRGHNLRWRYPLIHIL
jgi:hypothetical protein